MSEKIPENKYAGLTPEEIKEIELFTESAHLFGDSEEIKRFAEFQAEHTRLWFLFKHAMEDLQKDAPKFFYLTLIAARKGQQEFFDAIKNATKDTPLHESTEGLNAIQTMNTVTDLRFSSLFTNDGFTMREHLIETFEQDKGTEKLVSTLKQLQTLLPVL